MTMRTTSTCLEGTVRVGVDLCRVADVAEAIDRFGPRYVDRVYTAAEIGDGATAATAAPEHLAARFAAKEATFKVLRPDRAGIDWRTIEVVRDPGGWCDIRLRGAMAEQARRSGISSLTVALSHEAGMAVAVVVGLIAPEDDETSPRAAARTTTERVDTP
ncbi:holo-ACP synthase [Aquihabitans sp. McL0605]|uniref:holo-ACP synthase n=1 Tax=Aquihabitans sp. McL0605 TaxID=3415671 RepID=UPI003CE813EF